MKKLFLFATLCVLSLASLACDICGCGVGSYYIGILPDFNKRFIGLRYQLKGLTTHLSPSGDRSYLTTDEHYHSVELWGAWNIGKKFRLVGFVPVNYIERSSSTARKTKSGIGDIAVVGYYNLLNNESTTNHKPRRVVQSLWLGAGVKIPTGKYNPADKSNSNQELNTFQLGTGSVDFTLNAMYDLRIQDAGINTNLSYKINTANKYDYSYGNKFTGNVLGYYKFRVAKKATVAPNIGVLYEKSDYDLSADNTKVESSGGYSMMGTIGVETTFNKVSFGANYQNPLSQNLANHLVRANDRFMVHVSFGF